MSGDQFAGEKIRSIVTIDLMSRKAFDVLEQGEVAKHLGVVLRSVGADTGNVVGLDKDTLKMIGEKLGAQAVIMGSVDEYPVTESGTVSISLRMLDTASGTLLWQSNATVHSKGFLKDLVGLGGTHKSDASKKVVKKVLNTLL
ncbi:MAG: hypothetical protein OEV59_09305 [Deltaproteobacteria bacterium]|nr:hypothetical protein [Deltaproteobacteria bacterium]